MSVKIADFNATGHSAQDATTAFFNALDRARAENDVLQLGSGVYNITRPINILDYDRIEGVGRKSTLLRFRPDADNLGKNFILPENPTEFTDGVRFSRMSIHGLPKSPNTPVGVFGASLRTTKFDDVEFNFFDRFPYQGWGQRNQDGQIDNDNDLPGDSTYVTFEHVRFLGGLDSCRLGGTKSNISRIKGGTCNMYKFTGCRFALARRYGLWIEQGSSSLVEASSAVANGMSGIRCSWYHNMFSALTCENNGGWGIEFDWITNKESRDNTVIGIQDGGSNIKGLIRNGWRQKVY